MSNIGILSRETRENRHGFGHKENLLCFDGVKGYFTRILCFGIFDETVRAGGLVVVGASWKFGWFSWFGGYVPGRNNTREIE